jgi:hypothetical protein
MSPSLKFLGRIPVENLSAAMTLVSLDSPLQRRHSKLTGAGLLCPKGAVPVPYSHLHALSTSQIDHARKKVLAAA